MGLNGNILLIVSPHHLCCRCFISFSKGLSSYPKTTRCCLL